MKGEEEFKVQNCSAIKAEYSIGDALKIKTIEPAYIYINFIFSFNCK